jgi:hypothetical protein
LLLHFGLKERIEKGSTRGRGEMAERAAAAKLRSLEVGDGADQRVWSVSC